jgi:hypothetical protein
LLDVGYWSADNDFGQMFYNLWLHETLRSLCGIDLTTTFTRDMTENQKQEVMGTMEPGAHGVEAITVPSSWMGSQLQAGSAWGSHR